MQALTTEGKAYWAVVRLSDEGRFNTNHISRCGKGSIQPIEMMRRPSFLDARWVSSIDPI